MKSNTVRRPKRLQISKQKFLILSWIALLSSSVRPTLIFPPNTQAPSIANPSHYQKNRAAIALNRQKFACRYRTPGRYSILIQTKRSPKSIILYVAPNNNGVTFEITISYKDIAVIAYEGGYVGKAFYSFSSGTLERYYKPNPTIHDIRFLTEIKIGIPHVFASGNSGAYFLVDYTKKSPEDMIVVSKTFGGHTMFPFGTVFPDKPSPKVLFPSQGGELIRAGYATPSGEPLEVEESVPINFYIRKIQAVKGTDNIFASETTRDLYLINAMGPFDGTHILKKFDLPSFFTEESQQFVQMNHVLGHDGQDLVQFWTVGGRLLHFTFPENGKESQFFREVWHKRWK